MAMLICIRSSLNVQRTLRADSDWTKRPQKWSLQCCKTSRCYFFSFGGIFTLIWSFLHFENWSVMGQGGGVQCVNKTLVLTSYLSSTRKKTRTRFGNYGAELELSIKLNSSLVILCVNGLGALSSFSFLIILYIFILLSYVIALNMYC